MFISLIPMPVTMITSAVLWAMTRYVNKVPGVTVAAEILVERVAFPGAALAELKECISKYGIEAVTAISSIMKSGDINTIGEVTAHTFASRAATNHYYKAIAVAVDGLNIAYGYLFPANADTQNADVVAVDESADTIAVEVDNRVQNNASELHEFEL